MYRLTRLALSLAATLLALAPAALASVRVTGPKVISQNTVLPESCDGLRQDTDTMIAADPNDRRHLIAAWDVDDHKANVTAVSRDAGKTWKIAKVPGISKCTGGVSDEVVDPFVAIGARGHAFFTSLPISVSGFLTNRSPNGGSSWSAPSPADPDAGFTDDLPALAADPKHPKRAFLTWPHFQYTGNVQTGGDARFARSTDGGQSWSKPVVIRNSPQGKTVVESRLQLLSGGALLDVFGEPPAQPYTAPEQVYATRSQDAGRTWSKPVRIAQVDQDPILDPDTGKPIYQFCCLFGVATAPNDHAYLAYTKVAGAHSGKLLIARSKDGGRTWGPPHAVVSLATQTLNPAVAVADDGTVAVTWYDFRHDKAGDKPLTTDYWFAYSRDDGKTWRKSHLAGPFDLRSSRRTERPVGVYEGLAGLKHGFAATFIQAEPQAVNGAEDVFFAKVTPPKP